MRFPVLFLACGLVACGGKVGLLVELGGDAEPVVDTGTSVIDSGVRDTAPPPFDTAFDTSPTPVDVGPGTCATPLEPGFTCLAPTPKKGQKVCTEAAIQAIVSGCFGTTGGGSACDAARKKYPACDNCMLTEWIDDTGMSLDVAACIIAIAPGNPCGKTVKCGFDCLSNVCSSCDPSPGTGSGGMSEMDDCYNTESDVGGKCYAIAMKDYFECAGDPKISVCIPTTVESVIPFYRGACRDGGDWSKSSSP